MYNYGDKVLAARVVSMFVAFDIVVELIVVKSVAFIAEWIAVVFELRIEVMSVEFIRSAPSSLRPL